jgi:tetratricopeptide (TPR) repeat protein
VSRVLSRDPDRLPALRAAAELLIRKKEFEKARELLLHGVDLDRDDADAMLWLAWVHVAFPAAAVFAPRRGMEWAESALDLDPDLAPALALRAVALARLDRVAEARRNALEAMKAGLGAPRYRRLAEQVPPLEFGPERPWDADEPGGPRA